MTIPATTRDKRTGSRSAKRVLLMVAVLAILCITAIFQWTAPARNERFLLHSTLDDLRKRVSTDPNDGRAHYFLGTKLSESGDFSGATRELQRAAELRPDDEDVWLQWAKAAFRRGGPQAAHQILEHLLKTHPNSGRGHAAMASLYVRGGYWTSASEEATLAARLDPGSFDAWQAMGLAGLRIQDYRQATAGFGQCVELRPNDWHGYVGLSEAYYSQGRTLDALRESAESVRRAPAEPESHLQYGKVLLRAASSGEDLSAARRELEIPLNGKTALTPDRAFFASFYIGQTYLRQSTWPAARTWLERAASLAPNDPTVFHDLATVYQRLGDTKRFNAAVQKSTAINAYLSAAKALSDRIAGSPSDIESRLKLARLHASHGDVQDALKDYALLLVRDPGNGAAQRESAALRTGEALK